MDSDFTCFCNGVTEKEIKASISKGFKTVEEICKNTKTGNQCNSCRPRIQKLLDKSK